ncbi:actin depolymerizing protein [Thelephora ganbajun]|uniref:Actin depolymerizing protein n=1 Tax=Thelephora ganbajun TaxID=370292 RepID=A0ACB6Z495_THEGA|nr:actin depolymerizing protein [Thelephora ganbajun]
MSTSGIGPSAELTAAFSRAVDSKSTVRFIKVVISNESLVPAATIPPSGTFQQDLDKLVDVLEDNIPAYILARTDKPGSDWLAIFYVPDTSKVRDKMLYASTRNSVTRSLGSTHFTDSIFATSKDDVTGEAYARHLRHLAAPKPMSQREKVLAEMAEAEKQAADAYQGSNARKNHLSGAVVGFTWSPDVEEAFKQLVVEESSKLLVVTVETPGETLKLVSFEEVTAEQVGSKLPPSEPVFAFFGWPHNLSGSVPREIVFIYSCPSTSPVKHRMLYSSGSGSVYRTAGGLLSSIDGASPLATRKVETSDPKEINKTFLTNELGSSSTHSSSSSIPTRVGLGGTDNGGGVSTEAQRSVKELTQQFSRPRAPARKRP